MPRNRRKYNGPYERDQLERVAFPIGGIGAGMICLEGTGALTHVSVRNRPDIFNEPLICAVVCVKGKENAVKVLEGPIPNWKVFGFSRHHATMGLPRFREASFIARFPFGTVSLSDPRIPLKVEITGWSPFVPGDADSSSLPVAGLEYSFTNPTSETIDAVFSFNSASFMSVRNGKDRVLPTKNGFILWQEGSDEKPYEQGAFCACVGEEAIVDHVWFRSKWFDAFTVTWRSLAQGKCRSAEPVDEPSFGASLHVPFKLDAGQRKTVRVMLSWHVPFTNMRYSWDPQTASEAANATGSKPATYVPWYAGKFEDIEAVAGYWRDNYDELRRKTVTFTDCFYDTTLPDEVVEAIAANLTILESPTVLRQTDGRFWCWEGCGEIDGFCHGSCTHVWNYAQAVPHLFPDLERSLRETEFNECQDERGHQCFRAPLPIRPASHTVFAAADGQVGGIIKAYREWRVSGDTEWLKGLWPKIKTSIDYCIRTWDPKGKGVLEEPQHNTYDIEFWGPNSMCTSFYLGALTAAIEMGRTFGEDVSRYEELLSKGREYLETELYNGEYFHQKITMEGLETRYDDVKGGLVGYIESPESEELVAREGPKYQYGDGCLSDAILGFWLARMAGLGEIADEEKVRSTLESVHKYNYRKDLTDHANFQHARCAVNDDGGLLLCTWPKGPELTLPFPYSEMVWNGIEFQVASHLMLEGMVEEGLEIVRTSRDRYDGVTRNPFNSFEVAHWYSRALSCYGLIQGLTGVRYDAVDKTLFIDSRLGDNFRSFLSTASGFGTVGLKDGKPFVEMKMGELDIQHVYVSGTETALLE